MRPIETIRRSASSLLLVAVLVRIVDRHPLLRDLDVADLDAGNDFQALLGKHLGCFLGHVDVGHRKKVRQGFEEGHFGTQAAPDAAHFETDDAGADDREFLRHASMSSAPTLSQTISLSTGTPGR
jgi:hypothetical protein